MTRQAQIARVGEAGASGLRTILKYAAIGAGVLVSFAVTFVFVTWDSPHCEARLRVQRIGEMWLSSWPPAQQEYECLDGDIVRRVDSRSVVPIRPASPRFYTARGERR